MPRQDRYQFTRRPGTPTRYSTGRIADTAPAANTAPDPRQKPFVKGPQIFVPSSRVKWDNAYRQILRKLAYEFNRPIVEIRTLTPLELKRSAKTARNPVKARHSIRRLVRLLACEIPVRKV